MRLRYKKWQEEMINSHQDIAYSMDDVDKLPNFTDLEIGSGCGQFLIDMAKKYPARSFLGVEINRTAFAIAVKKLVNTIDAPVNLVYINIPIEKLIPSIKKESLNSIYLNFSDPWPKVRHHKRRLTHPDKLKEYLTLLKPKGKIYFKTDNQILFDASVEYFLSVKELDTTIDTDYQLEESDCYTEYETKFREKGVKICRIVAQKI